MFGILNMTPCKNTIKLPSASVTLSFSVLKITCIYSDIKCLEVG